MHGLHLWDKRGFSTLCYFICTGCHRTVACVVLGGTPGENGNRALSRATALAALCWCVCSRCTINLWAKPPLHPLLLLPAVADA